LFPWPMMNSAIL